MDDLISRKAALDAIMSLYILVPKIGNDFVYDMAIDQAYDMVKDLPSVETMFIKCKDCVNLDEYGYCAWAKRRKNETD